MLHQIFTEGKIFNWYDILAQQLNINVNNENNPPKGKQAKLYMFGYLLGGLCAHNAFLNMD